MVAYETNNQINLSIPNNPKNSSNTRNLNNSNNLHSVHKLNPHRTNNNSGRPKSQTRRSKKKIPTYGSCFQKFLAWMTLGHVGIRMSKGFFVSVVIYFDRIFEIFRKFDQSKNRNFFLKCIKLELSLFSCGISFTVISV